MPDLVAEDVSVVMRERPGAALGQVIPYRRPRFLGKVTGWPRIDFLRTTFPDAKFIVIGRDGRAVANSLLNVRFWHGRLGPYRWRWGPLPPDLSQKWEA